MAFETENLFYLVIAEGNKDKPERRETQQAAFDLAYKKALDNDFGFYVCKVIASHKRVENDKTKVWINPLKDEFKNLDWFDQEIEKIRKERGQQKLEL